MTKRNLNDVDISLNPFIVESPERLSPEQIVELFIGEYTNLETLRQRKHTILWGPRGSGKSMLFRYLEPQCQALEFGGLNNFLDTPNPFWAVYCPLKEGYSNPKGLEVMSELSGQILSEHILNIYIAERVIDSLKNQASKKLLAEKQIESFIDQAIHLFDRPSISSSIKEADQQMQLSEDPIAWFSNLLHSEKVKISYYIRKNAQVGGGIKYQGSTSGYHDFLLPFLGALQNFSFLNGIPIFLMIDDVQKIRAFEQKNINTWIANRDHNIVSIKASSNRDGYKTFLTRDGGLIEQPHDYSEIDNDELYSRQKSDYYKKVKLISEKRLEISVIPTKSITEFLPLDANEEKLYSEIRRQTKEEWRDAGKPGKQSDYLVRYAKPRLFQYLAKAKKKKSYAGFENLVHISSGVVRDFLEPCWLMVADNISKGNKSHTITSISAPLQNNIINRYSEEFLLTRFDEIKRDEEAIVGNGAQVDALATLIESLGRLFYMRLHDPKTREARLFSFTVRETPPKELSDILQLGVKHRYFQLRSYGTKEGGGLERWYILNRRICPRYKLDPTGFEGRLSLTIEALRIGTQSPSGFVKLRLKREDEKPSKESGTQIPLFSIIENY